MPRCSGDSLGRLGFGGPSWQCCGPDWWRANDQRDVVSVDAVQCLEHLVVKSASVNAEGDPLGSKVKRRLFVVSGVWLHDRMTSGSLAHHPSSHALNATEKYIYIPDTIG